MSQCKVISLLTTKESFIVLSNDLFEMWRHLLRLPNLLCKLASTHQLHLALLKHRGIPRRHVMKSKSNKCNESSDAELKGTTSSSSSLMKKIVNKKSFLCLHNPCVQTWHRQKTLLWSVLNSCYLQHYKWMEIAQLSWTKHSIRIVSEWLKLGCDDMRVGTETKQIDWLRDIVKCGFLAHWLLCDAWLQNHHFTNDWSFLLAPNRGCVTGWEEVVQEMLWKKTVAWSGGEMHWSTDWHDSTLMTWYLRSWETRFVVNKFKKSFEPHVSVCEENVLLVLVVAMSILSLHFFNDC